MRALRPHLIAVAALALGIGLGHHADAAPRSPDAPHAKISASAEVPPRASAIEIVAGIDPQTCRDLPQYCPAGPPSRTLFTPNGEGAPGAAIDVTAGCAATDAAESSEDPADKAALAEVSSASGAADQGCPTRFSRLDQGADEVRSSVEGPALAPADPQSVLLDARLVVLDEKAFRALAPTLGVGAGQATAFKMLVASGDALMLSREVLTGLAGRSVGFDADGELPAATPTEAAVEAVMYYAAKVKLEAEAADGRVRLQAAASVVLTDAQGAPSVMQLQRAAELDRGDILLLTSALPVSPAHAGGKPRREGPFADHAHFGLVVLPKMQGGAPAVVQAAAGAPAESALPEVAYAAPAPARQPMLARTRRAARREVVRLAHYVLTPVHRIRTLLADVVRVRERSV